ncbi:ER membrane glycoprotein subunit of the GPI transamidase complex-like protein [Kickxella alabastrina]|uniref:ER membrane glycoprotein subunit of the GPI transamidase complex-like protein n=1 Tax=Kickxella alabastrina TaxID=61397 RepID=A0ACC1IBA0_9FUNG|nr:ER membrane glycoprotein subunit of the GPI transamidase complex-like protein [Kickxella alabastrina]
MVSPRKAVSGSGPKDKRSRLWSVIKWAVVSRMASLALGIVSNAVIDDYDASLGVFLAAAPSGNSGHLSLLCSRLARGLAQVVVRWDAFYFVHIADSGYVYEQEHAFFPLLPLLMRLLARTVLAPLAALAGRQLALVVAGVAISNVSFVLAAGTIYRLGCATLRSERLAYIAALLYTVAPSNMFMTAVYTESLFAWLVFSALLLISRRKYLLASLCLAASSLCRSNGVMYSGFIVWDLIVRSDARDGSTSSSGRRALLWQALKATVLVAISALGFIAFQAFGKRELCQQPIHPPAASARPYCESSLSTVYGFVQAEYWDIGFLRYYTLQQLPNFLLAAPMVVLSGAGLWAYATHDPLRVATLGLRMRKRKLSAVQSVAAEEEADADADAEADEEAEAEIQATAAYFSDSLLPHMYFWAVLLGVAAATMHMQVITRFFSSVPAVFWFAAHVVAASLPPPVSGQRTMATTTAKAALKTPAVALAAVGYFAAYGLAGVVLFSNFFPPA